MMSRLERNHRRKQRRRRVFFSLLLIAVLFLLALIATNNTMVKATGLSPDKNLFSMQRLQAYVGNKAGFIANRIREIDIESIKQESEQLLDHLVDF